MALAYSLPLLSAVSLHNDHMITLSQIGDRYLLKREVAWMCNVTVQNGPTSHNLRWRLENVFINEVVRTGIWQWSGHVERGQG